MVKGLSLLALGDCQLLAVLRAIQKGNQPSLIASIAQDTANLYGSALQSVRYLGGAGSGWLRSASRCSVFLLVGATECGRQVPAKLMLGT